jgi:hypothetical protein
VSRYETHYNHRKEEVLKLKQQTVSSKLQDLILALEVRCTKEELKLLGEQFHTTYDTTLGGEVSCPKLEQRVRRFVSDNLSLRIVVVSTPATVSHQEA